MREKKDMKPVVCFQHVMSPTGTGKDDPDSGCSVVSMSSSESRSMFSLDCTDTGERTSDSPSCFGVSMFLLLVARGSARMLEEELPTEIPSWLSFVIFVLLVLCFACACASVSVSVSSFYSIDRCVSICNYVFAVCWKRLFPLLYWLM